jgi:hypothetical protein
MLKSRKDGGSKQAKNKDTNGEGFAVRTMSAEDRKIFETPHVYYKHAKESAADNVFFL